ncbi:MAG: hypothetical protein Q9217_000784 [Psora testacea]
MADGLCGPSNALQSFQKHSSVDRTLQQDRLAPRRSPAEKFRSYSGPNAGLLDAEFEAFQAGNPLGTSFPEPPTLFNGPPQNAFQNGFQQPEWASDFENLQLNEARATSYPLPQPHHHQAPSQQGTSPMWHQDFLRQQNQSLGSPPQQSSPASQPSFQNMPSYSRSTIPVYHSEGSLATRSQGKQKEADRDADFDDAAFEQAFKEVQGSSVRINENESVILEEQSSKRFAEETEERETQPVAYRIGSDQLLDESRAKKGEHNEADEADELARTARNLLENVKGDQSAKFLESNFLSLMRRLRDREVKVDGDKIVDNVSQYA